MPKQSPQLMHDPESNDAVARDTQTRFRAERELDKSFLVEAAAGTGKTTIIVKRMIQLIATGACDISRLVAVTFTRKAAAELRGRFEASLRENAQLTASKLADRELDQAARQRMLDACNRSNQAFVGTIHSFCASLLRERPIEFGVDPTFRELTEGEDKQLIDSAWHSNINNLLAAQDPLLERMSELGIVRNQLKHSFHQIINNRDIEHWPASTPQPPDLQSTKLEIQSYIDHMKTLLPTFPVDRGTDELMNRYEEIVRASQRDWTHPAGFIRLLQRFDSSDGATQKYWDKPATGKAEKNRWVDFRERIVEPTLKYWYAKRYPLVIEFVTRAASIYEKLKRSNDGLDFTDLMLRVVGGLRSQAELRAYFQKRYTHLLVDEFQDTDPIQAEMLMLLCSADHHEQDWTRCKLRAGSLFIVGDPKQSIYRFRRGDIVTYDRMRKLIEASNGEVLALIKNFRTVSSIRNWNNEVFSNLFGATGSQYSPAAEDMIQGREAASQSTTPFPTIPPLPLHGLFQLPVQKYGNSADTEGEADAIARTIRCAIDGGVTIERTPEELKAGRTTTAEPRDFLIIPPRRSNIRIYKAALDRYKIPCDVTGGNAVKGLDELELLTKVLKCIDDPYDSIAFLTLLRNQLFGFSDVELFELRQRNAKFIYSAPPSGLGDASGGDSHETLDRYASVCARLSSYAQWLRTLPYAVGVTRIAEDLGLLAKAAGCEEGNIAAGGFLKAIEWLRQRSYDFDSVADVVESFDELIEADEFEGCTALPNNSNVVRLMNLHKAKGLEAPVVFLTDIGSPRKHPVYSYIDRRGNSDRVNVLGYVCVQEEVKKGNRPAYFKPIACPAEWESLEAEEQRFLDAEKDRLLYVATTRAGCALIISTGNDKSAWAKLYPFMQNAPQLPINQMQFTQSATGQPTASKSLAVATTQPNIAERWQVSQQPNYAIRTAKEIAFKGVRQPRWETSGDYGYRWGSVIHELLSISIKTPNINLRPSALNLAREYGLSHDRIDELISTVESVTRSDIWQRAQAASQCYSELPFETLATTDGLPTIVRGVIDLIFEEPASTTAPAGWVIVDYKSDDIATSDLDAAVKYYQAQLQEYAKHWTQLTSYPTKELGLYFTKLNRYEIVQ